ncbi:PPE family protein [Mycobacterium intracellulare]|uniref:PPE family protein n=1 Tax=Mycobacterium intracellulare TaxID=1767 RepID=UPI00335CD12A
MLDFGALPPEINSARMYAGPGSAPMSAAASAWDALAAQLESHAAGYSATLSELRGRAWSGDAATAMAAAVEPYVAWASTTAAQAGQTAAQARAAAAAYEAAFAATVPPHVVAANRFALLTLIATNFFGQNAAAIAATETAYAEMWAQDATAMYGYAATSSAAAAFTPFTEPPRTTNAHGQSAQAAAVNEAAGTAAGQARAALASGVVTNASSAGLGEAPAAGSGLSLIGSVDDFNTLITTPGQTFLAGARTLLGWGQLGYGLDLSDIQAAKAAEGGVPIVPDIPAPAVPQVAGVRGPVLGGLGRAALVGKLSVPQTWTVANPAPTAGIGLKPLPDTMFRAASASAADPSNVPGPLAATRTAGQAGVPVLRNGRRIFKMPRPAYGG